MNRNQKKVNRLLNNGVDPKEVSKKYPASYNKVMKYRKYKEFQGKTPEPWGH